MYKVQICPINRRIISIVLLDIIDIDNTGTNEILCIPNSEYYPSAHLSFSRIGIPERPLSLMVFLPKVHKPEIFFPDIRC